ncbi:hypothetical protein [Clostridium estertheticum]|uniref:hypothetical protein n=1 Tax=Clostridium estertheticum TaxID=238834 RepID=UPI001C0B80F9|nr:hypothetical protein [Clostridium estertheticum]MBU3186540.1 hypothetical protein [Clostridium estertheticum]
MEVSDSELQKYKDRLNRKIKRNEERIADYKARKGSLSIHGYWSLGYFEGINSELENLLDDINAI